MGMTIEVYGFPRREPAEKVLHFLEHYTGSGTVDAIEVLQCKKGRACAKVQFTTNKDAKRIISLANQCLWYGKSYLKVSRDKFSVLWKSANVSVKFGFGLGKMYFFLSYRSVEYKLELSYENIWQIELHRPHGQPKFLLVQELQEYFTNYIVNDSLGIISNAHLVFADKEPNKAMSNPCIELAKLSSIAVDIPKTGVPAEIPSHVRPKKYPDFMEKLDKTTYESENVIGKLFREVKDIATEKCSIKSFTMEVAMRSYDPDMEIDGFEDYINDALDYKATMITSWRI